MSNQLSTKQAELLIKKKEPILGALLTFFFGALGYFYVSIFGGFIALVIELLLVALAFITFGLGAFFVGAFHIILPFIAYWRISKYNKDIIKNLQNID